MTILAWQWKFCSFSEFSLDIGCTTGPELHLVVDPNLYIFRLRRNHTLIFWILFIKQNCHEILLFNMKVNTNFFMILFEIFFLVNMPIWWKLESYLIMALNDYPALNLSKPIMTSLRKWWDHLQGDSSYKMTLVIRVSRQINYYSRHFSIQLSMMIRRVIRQARSLTPMMKKLSNKLSHL